MNSFLTFYATLSDKQKGLTQGLIMGVVLALICSVLTFHYTSSYYQDKCTQIENKLSAYQATHPDDGEAKKEQDLIAKAIADKQNKVPLTETVGQENTTEISYQAKTSKDYADVEVTNTIKPVVVSYNGKKQELKTVTSENQTVGADGKVVITQQSAAVLDIDSIVNREIANKVLEDDHDKAVLERQKKQNAFWGAVGGYVVGSMLHK